MRKNHDTYFLSVSRRLLILIRKSVSSESVEMSKYHSQVIALASSSPTGHVFLGDCSRQLQRQPNPFEPSLSHSLGQRDQVLCRARSAMSAAAECALAFPGANFFVRLIFRIEACMHCIEKECPVCGYGSIGFFRCSDGKTLALVCDECSCAWLSADDISPENADGPQSPDFRLNGMDIGLAGPLAGWALLEEITNSGLGSYISK